MPLSSPKGTPLGRVPVRVEGQTVPPKNRQHLGEGESPPNPTYQMLGSHPKFRCRIWGRCPKDRGGLSLPFLFPNPILPETLLGFLFE